MYPCTFNNLPLKLKKIKMKINLIVTLLCVTCVQSLLRPKWKQPVHRPAVDNDDGDDDEGDNPNPIRKLKIPNIGPRFRWE